MQLYARILVYSPNLISADEAHPPNREREEEERLAVSVISVFIATKPCVSAGDASHLNHVLTTDI